MKKEESINKTIESIKIIEEQIKYFEDNKPLFFQKKKLKEYNKRIECLEYIKHSLYKKLEYNLDNNRKKKT